VHKRPQLFVDLLRELPETKGVMILNPRDDAFESELRRSAPANLRIVSHVPFPAMPLVFSRAAALVNTSSLEGFANVFLQAGLSRVPVVSLQVGGPFLTASGVGVDCEGDWNCFVKAARTAWLSPRSAEELNRARSFVVENHSLPMVVERLMDVLWSFGVVNQM
jgi:glycosyltransferase involved in cell wall biosynthesis